MTHQVRKPKEFTVNEQDPYQDSLSNRKELGDILTSLVTNSEESLVLNLDAAWGMGKSKFVEMWQKDLSKQGFKVIYFDAFKYDYFGDPFIPLSGEILSTMKESHYTQSSDFKEKTINVLKWFGSQAIYKGITLIPYLGFKKSELKEMKKELKEIFSNGFDAALENMLVSFQAEMRPEDEFKNILKDYAKYLFEQVDEKIKQKRQKPLVIIIDELDRCKPIFAVELLERIKHFFNVNHIVFLLVTNKNQLVKCIESIYGTQDGEIYLQKFIDFNFTLINNIDSSSKSIDL
jgi:predicted KAP-like P-loop ATPase